MQAYVSIIGCRKPNSEGRLGVEARTIKCLETVAFLLFGATDVARGMYKALVTK